MRPYHQRQTEALLCALWAAIDVLGGAQLDEATYSPETRWPEAVAIAEAAAPRLKRFEVFHRTWWRAEGVPGVGESHHVAWASTEAHARHLCRRWNDGHAPGPLSDRAEFTAA